MMALRALHHHARESPAGRCDHNVAIKVARNLAVYLGFWNFGVSDQVPGSRGDKSRGLDRVGTVGMKHVAGELFLHKLRVRLVPIESANNVIAIGPRIGPGLVFIIAMAIPIMNDIQPMPGPMFAVPWGSQKSIDQLFIASGIL